LWALDVLGLGTTAGLKEVQRRYRTLLREAHPDHGGGIDEAADRIADLGAARRILLEG
jgi:curved DNA-binding protein CbpA